ncbi:MAG: hypothetical protein SPI23_07695, partial [Desulfovibrio sp.]|uniref:hypothetical protein n=1 Tax=Desulfovibrio sp. TaxID=885 RepID=UPI002A90F926
QGALSLANHRDADGVAQDGNVLQYTDWQMLQGKCAASRVFLDDSWKKTEQGRADVRATNQNRPSKDTQRVSFHFALWRSVGQNNKKGAPKSAFLKSGYVVAICPWRP